MKYRMIAIDLDDSLLNDDIMISEKNKRALRYAVEQGVIVTIATGRMFRSTIPFIKQLGIDSPVITYQGALVINPSTSEMLVHIPVELDIAREIISICQEKIYIYRYLLMINIIMSRIMNIRLFTGG